MLGIQTSLLGIQTSLLGIQTSLLGIQNYCWVYKLIVGYTKLLLGFVPQPNLQSVLLHTDINLLCCYRKVIAYAKLLKYKPFQASINENKQTIQC
ncbi:MAG: hypothetical protein F6K08_08285 [Okeania sp. SIO1H6]|uniref:hypothetical protein n=1 Tax=Okeania sp. SIO2B9 TaxID=2607782 RepID=UPI0013CDAE6D|nr:hypothetical protein [Okeania sp. SIO2B9]NET12846.1 hypothetical protein [Okeania sp. SIO1H6]